jgi:hypothetical protein
MNLEEIITAAVEKRISELVSQMIEHRPEVYSTTEPERVVQNVIGAIARDEVKKHEPAIRASIQKSLAELPSTISITAYTEIKMPRDAGR